MKKSTRTSVSGGELVKEDQNPSKMDGFRGDEEVVVIVDEQLERHQRCQQRHRRQEGLHLGGLAAHPHKELVQRRAPLTPHG